MLGDNEDVCRKKQLSTVALNKLQNVWTRKDKIKQALKIKLYKSLVKPVLVYNSGTWRLTRKEEEDLNAFHRQQLRRILNIKYPTIVRNKQLYKQTGEKVLSLRRFSTYRKCSVDRKGKENFPQTGTENFPLLISTFLRGQERKTVFYQHGRPKYDKDETTTTSKSNE